MRAFLHDFEDLDAAIVSAAKKRASIPSNGRLYDAKLPSVLRLRMYRVTLTADMKTAIKTAVVVLLSVLVTRTLESGFSTGEKTGDADGGGSSLASRLRSLSSESFVQLSGAVFKIVLVMYAQALPVTPSVAC